MTKHVHIIVALSIAAALGLSAGCGSRPDVNTTTNIHGLDERNLDPTCAPCEDFYQYANGGWMARNPIPEEYPFWSTSLEAFERNNTILREILEDAAAGDAAPGSLARKIGDFYHSALDSARTEADDLRPIQADLDRIAAIASVDDLAEVITHHHAQGFSLIFAAIAQQDLVDSEMVILYLISAGLGLPDRDYYTRQDEESVALREKYLAHVVAMLELLGDPPAAARRRAEAILAMETRLAEASLTAVEKRNPATWYGVKSVAQADSLVPAISWRRYLDALGLPDTKSFSMAPDTFFRTLGDMLVDVPLEHWRHYLRWHAVHAAFPYLSSRFLDEGFRFYGQTLTGQEQIPPRWKRAKSAVSGSLGEALGQLYIERAFPPEAKTRALELVGNLKVALREKIESLPWMSPETKAQALHKLDGFGAKIGYPDEWKDYSDLEIVRGPWIENMRRAQRFTLRFEMDKVGHPPDRTEWVTNPQTVNAFYHPLMNEITFPAGILQPPMFDVAIDDAVNYGSMGVVIGHEMIHGFDDTGRRFDADGNMVDWWTEEDDRKFRELAGRMVEQFAAYVVVDSLHVNGQLTLGENIADRGGLRIAYRALQLARQGKEDPMVDGLTQEQRFFLSFAQFFRAKFKPEMLKIIVNTDPHSPNMFRVNGPLSHMTEFAEAFGCRPGDRMYTPPDEQVHVW